jgi:hypothetical protein
MDTGKYAEEYRKLHGLPSLKQLLAETPTPHIVEPDTKQEQQPKKQPQNETQSQNLMTFLMGKTLELMKQAQVYGQAYEQLQQNYMKVANIYQNQLMQILPAIAMLTAKTPLSSMTEDDLTQHIEQLYTTVPFQVALANTDKLVKGYYIAKINGINTRELDTADLMQVADNPAFAQSTNDNLAQFLAQLGGIIQMKMQTALKQAGMVKDMYQEQLKQMQIHAQLMHYIATALTNMAKEEEMERHHRAEEELWRDRIGVERGRLQLREQYLKLLQQHYGDEASHWQNEDNYKVWKASQPKTKKSSSSSSSNTAGSNTSQSSSTIRPFP